MINIEKNVQKIKEIVLENRHVFLKEVSSELNLVYGTAQHILVDILSMKQVAERVAPKYLISV